MAKTKRYTIALENRPGALAEVVRTLANAKVNILAVSGTAQETSGAAEFVVEDARAAKRALDKAKIAYQESTAEAHELPNKPGALAEYLSKLAKRGVNLDSIFATACKGGKSAMVIYRVSEREEKMEPSAFF